MTNITSQEFGDRLKLTYVIIGIFLLIVLDVLTDFLFKIPESKLIFKAILAGGNLIFMGYLVYFIWNKFDRDDAIKHGLTRAKLKAQADADRYESKAIELTDRFEDFIARQFKNWELSPSEKEIAHLLLVGKSSKEIAQTRYTSERTIRNQCRFIYEKSGCGGRSELSAFFFNTFIKQ
ncbi:MAG: helix-turn-helix transcriptional regulator [Bacteriovoracaceae bacterium]|nr:helix-turn-helix transcriptional regulator [Bacteriovoracaceae bacterium]